MTAEIARFARLAIDDPSAAAAEDAATLASVAAWLRWASSGCPLPAPSSSGSILPLMKTSLRVNAALAVAVSGDPALYTPARRTTWDTLLREPAAGMIDPSEAIGWFEKQIWATIGSH